MLNSAPASDARDARYWSNLSRSVVYPLNSSMVSLSSGSIRSIPTVSRQWSSSGIVNKDSMSFSLGNMFIISSLEGMNSPHLTGTPTCGRLSNTITDAPDSAAYLAVTLPAGPEPTIRMSTSSDMLTSYRDSL